MSDDKHMRFWNKFLKLLNIHIYTHTYILGVFIHTQVIFDSVTHILNLEKFYAVINRGKKFTRTELSSFSIVIISQLVFLKNPQLIMQVFITIIDS